MAQPDRRQFYTDNGAAAYDIYSWNDSAARRYEDGRAYEQPRRQQLPEEQVREQPYRRVKSRTAIAPFTLVGMLTVACLMILVIFGYVQLFEASSSVSKLENQLANLKEQQLMLQSKYDAKIDLAAAEAHAAFPAPTRRRSIPSSAPASSARSSTPCSRASSASSSISTPQPKPHI